MFFYLTPDTIDAMAYDFKELDEGIVKTTEWLQADLKTVRTGRANPSILDHVMVEAYGGQLPLSQVGSVSTEDARTLRISVWDQGLAKAVERGLQEANLGLSVMADDTGIRVISPELTGERRDELKKVVKTKLEEARVRLRGVRATTMQQLDAQKKEGLSEDDHHRYQADVQKKIDAGMEALEAVADKKSAEIAE